MCKTRTRAHLVGQLGRVTVTRTHRRLDRCYRDLYNSHVYRVLYTDTARKQYDKLDARLRRQVDNAIDRISRDPTIGKPLKGELKGIRSERVSNFRVLYKVYETRVEILVLVIEHRRIVYGGH